MEQQLPRFAEIADMRCQEASLGTKTINIKVAINTARMMVESEIKEHKNYRLLIERTKCRIAWLSSVCSALPAKIYPMYEEAFRSEIASDEALLRDLGEIE